MGFPFQPKVDVTPSTTVTSEPITITDLFQPTLVSIQTGSTLADAQLVHNGSPVGSSVTVSNNDTLAVTGTSPSTYATPAFVPVLLEGEAVSIFGVITEADPASAILDPAYVDAPQSNFFDGYTPSSPDNKLLTVTTSDDSTQSTNIAVVGSPDGGTFGDGLSYVFAADYVANYVHRINPSTGIVVHSIAINNPHGLGYTPTEAPTETSVAHTLISSPDNNTVYVYDGDNHTQIQSVTTGAGPHGVCGEPTDTEGNYGFWVACFDADRVEHWQYISGSALVRDFYYDLTAGSGPYDVQVDTDGNAWVTCLKSDKVARCPAGGGGTVVYVDVGIDPWDIDLSSTHAYAACAGTDKVYAVDLATNAATALTTFDNPTHVTVAGSKLYVGSFNYGTFKSYALSTATSLGIATDISVSQRMFEGMIESADAATVFALNMHNDMPERTALSDQSPDSLALTSQSNVTTSTPVTSNDVTISGTDATSYLYVPDLYGMSLNVNGSDVGQTATIVDGDTVSVNATTPSESLKLYLPVMYVGGAQTWLVSMLPGPKLRLSGWIQGG